MHQARRVWLFILALGSVTLIAKTETDDQWKRLVALRAPIKRVDVLSGSDLQIDGIRCRLFGIRSPEDPKVRALAKRFLALYMKDSGGYFYVYNVTAPISDADGVPLVWVQAAASCGWAQETLVQAGLANVNYTGYEHYKFRVPAWRIGEKWFDWKRCLKEAKAYCESGKKPDVLFAWPERRSN